MFRFRCTEHGESDHPDRDVKVCWCGNRLLRVYVMPHIAAAARPTSAGRSLDIARREKKLDADRAAYRRLRDDGIQPKSIDGCAVLESRAETKTEIEMGKVMPLKKVLEGAARSSEVMGKDITA